MNHNLYGVRTSHINNRMENEILITSPLILLTSNDNLNPTSNLHINLSSMMKQREGIVFTTKFFMYILVAFSMVNFIWTFVDADEKTLIYTFTNSPKEIIQLVYQNTQNLTGFILNMCHLIVMLFFSIDIKNQLLMRKISQFFNKKIATILTFLSYFTLYGVIIFNFSTLVTCAATNSGGNTEIIYGTDSKDIPIVDFLNNSYWYCGISGSNAAPNVWNYYNNVLDTCGNYDNILSNIQCNFNTGWDPIEGFLHVYFLLFWYALMLADMVVSNILLYKIDKATEAVELIKNNPVK